MSLMTDPRMEWIKAYVRGRPLSAGENSDMASQKDMMHDISVFINEMGKKYGKIDNPEFVKLVIADYLSNNVIAQRIWLKEDVTDMCAHLFRGLMTEDEEPRVYQRALELFKITGTAKTFSETTVEEHTQLVRIVTAAGMELGLK